MTTYIEFFEMKKFGRFIILAIMPFFFLFAGKELIGAKDLSEKILLVQEDQKTGLIDEDRKLLEELDVRTDKGVPSDAASDDVDDLFQELDKEMKDEGSSDEGLFKELDMLSGVGEEPKKPKKGGIYGFFKDLGKGFEGTLIPRVMVHLENFETNEEERRDEGHGFFDTRLEGKTQAMWGKYLFNIAAWSEVGNQRGTYAGLAQFMRDTDHRRRYVELNQLYVTRSWENFDVTVGKKTFPLGLSTLYTPTDRINPQDLNDPLNYKTLGVWLSSLDYYYKDTTFTLAAFPFFSPNKVPDYTSRWAGKSEKGTRVDYEIDMDEVEGEAEIHDSYPAPGNIQGLFQVKTVFKGWDLFAAFFHGFSPFPVLKQIESGATTEGTSGTTEAATAGKKTFEKQHPEVFTVNGGFSTTYKKLELHGEGIFQYAYEGKDDNYLDYVLGFTYTLDNLAHKIDHDRIDLTLEYGGEYLIKEQSAPNYERSSIDSRVIRNNLLGRLFFKYSENLSWHYEWIWDLNDESWAHLVNFEYKLRDGLIMKTGAEIFYGKDESTFERWEDNDRLILQFEYRF